MIIVLSSIIKQTNLPLLKTIKKKLAYISKEDSKPYNPKYVPFMASK